jgi:hypothetical protein
MMMSTLARLILAIVIGAHGLGHILFLVPLLGRADWGQPAQSWLWGRGGLAKGVGSLIWLVAILGLAAAAVGLFQMTDWWRAVAIVAALVSTAGLLLFWVSPPGSPVVSALVLNLLVLAALVIFHWPSVTEPAG